MAVTFTLISAQPTLAASSSKASCSHSSVKRSHIRLIKAAGHISVYRMPIKTYTRGPWRRASRSAVYACATSNSKPLTLGTELEDADWPIEIRISSIHIAGEWVAWYRDEDVGEITSNYPSIYRANVKKRKVERVAGTPPNYNSDTESLSVPNHGWIRSDGRVIFETVSQDRSFNGISGLWVSMPDRPAEPVIQHTNRLLPVLQRDEFALTASGGEFTNKTQLGTVGPISIDDQLNTARTKCQAPVGFQAIDVTTLGKLFARDSGSAKRPSYTFAYCLYRDNKTVVTNLACIVYSYASILDDVLIVACLGKQSYAFRQELDEEEQKGLSSSLPDRDQLKMVDLASGQVRLEAEVNGGVASAILPTTSRLSMAWLSRDNLGTQYWVSKVQSGNAASEVARAPKYRIFSNPTMQGNTFSWDVDGTRSPDGRPRRQTAELP